MEKDGNPWYISAFVFMIMLTAAGPSPLVIPLIYYVGIGFDHTTWPGWMSYFETDLYRVVAVPIIILFTIYWINGIFLFIIDITGLAHW